LNSSGEAIFSSHFGGHSMFGGQYMNWQSSQVRIFYLLAVVFLALLKIQEQSSWVQVLCCYEDLCFKLGCVESCMIHTV